jgi:hypothetical protein
VSPFSIFMPPGLHRGRTSCLDKRKQGGGLMGTGKAMMHDGYRCLGHPCEQQDSGYLELAHCSSLSSPGDLHPEEN